ncbi:hypothetical protein [Ascidiimonas sp. W6]|uniref:hypothetical protein n=1 Tax=Ascidiimonas meishanensis TaxID=3128903 RepID=UPI0030EED4BD
MKKKIVKSSLTLNKKTIGNLNTISGGRPPGSRDCTIVNPGPITIETICWTESRDAGSNCWCSSDDSFAC